MTIHAQKFDGSIYVVIGQQALWLTVEQAQDLAAKLDKICVTEAKR